MFLFLHKFVKIRDISLCVSGKNQNSQKNVFFRFNDWLMELNLLEHPCHILMGM